MILPSYVAFDSFDSLIANIFIMAMMYFYHGSDQSHERSHIHESQNGHHGGDDSEGMLAEMLSFSLSVAEGPGFLFGISKMTFMEWLVATPIQVETLRIYSSRVTKL